jgi:hypothetical protein
MVYLADKVKKVDEMKVKVHAEQEPSKAFDL